MDVLRRKMGRIAPDATAGNGEGADRGWRLALARAARDHVALTLDVTALRDRRLSLGELVEELPERSLIAVLDAAGGDGLGLIAVDPVILSGMIGMLTTGRVAAGTDAPRRPTRTDAAMVAPMIDAALAGLALALTGQEDAGWAEGWRYASFLDEPRPLALLLEDCGYRLLQAEVSLLHGAASGVIILALPAATRTRPVEPVADTDAEAGAEAFRAAFARQVEGVTCRIETELARLTLPLARVLALQTGEVVPLGAATVSRLVLRGVDGLPLAEGKLGQMRGQRAVRLALPLDDAARLAG